MSDKRRSSNKYSFAAAHMKQKGNGHIRLMRNMMGREEDRPKPVREYMDEGLNAIVQVYARGYAMGYRCLPRSLDY